MKNKYLERKQIGKTQQFSDIGFTYNDKDYTLIDTPGHQSFIRSMKSGISREGVDIAVLMVSAIENEFNLVLKEEC